MAEYLTFGELDIGEKFIFIPEKIKARSSPLFIKLGCGGENAILIATGVVYAVNDEQKVISVQL